MIESVAVPVLLKAVDWLFDQGSKILAERRERRKTQPQNTANNPPASSGKDEVTKPADIITSKETALSQIISESAWMASQAKVDHLLSLLDIYTKNYYLAKEEYAKWGSALVPPIITHNLAEAEDGIAKTLKELQSALSKVYGKTVSSPEVDLS